MAEELCALARMERSPSRKLYGGIRNEGLRLKFKLAELCEFIRASDGCSCTGLRRLLIA